MSRAWRIYFGAVAAFFVCVSVMAFLVLANQRRVDASMEAKWARGETPAGVKATKGDHTPLNSAFP